MPFDGSLPFLGTVLGFAFIVWAWRISYIARLRFVSLRRAELPIAPDWSWLTGNLLLIDKMYEFVPRKSTKVNLFREILSRFTKTGCCYIDLWPFSRPFLLVMSPYLATQVTQDVQEIAESRPLELKELFFPLCGGMNLFDLPAAQWKHWRVVFNKGFSPDTISILIPEMVGQAVKYRDVLFKYAAKGELFQLDKVTLRFAMDFIGHAALNAPMRTQEGYDELGDSMLSQVRWLPILQSPNPLEKINIPRMIVNWWNGRKMGRYIGAHLDRRYSELVRSDQPIASKSIMDLVLKTHLLDSKARSRSLQPPEELDPSFRSFAIRQIRLFLFAGHDATSSTICYAMHLLAINPSTLRQIREEHDRVFGQNVSSTAATIIANPALLNQIPYTLAVLKETLRLFPPASGIRSGAPGKVLVGEDGTQYPTDGFIVWIIHLATQRSPVYWPQPDRFLPQRWLVGPDDPLYPTKNAWRPFEQGARNCIGQSLAITELKIVMAMICRTFDFTPGYAEWDRKHPTKGMQDYRGERAYQIAEGAAHPADHYPCRISVAKRLY